MQMQASCPRKLLSGFLCLRVGDRYQIFHHFALPVVELKRYHSLCEESIAHHIKLAIKLEDDSIVRERSH